MTWFPSSSRKGFGLKFQEGKIETHGLDRLGLKLESIPAEYLDHLEDIPKIDDKPYILDQGATSSCVANAFVAALHMMEVRAGLPFEEISRLFPYYTSRREHDSHLWDSGTYLHTCAHGLRVVGACNEEHWKWSQLTPKVNRRPNWNAMRFAHPRRGGKYVRIYELGDERIKAIQQAILNGYDVAFGTRLGVTFPPFEGKELIDIPPPTEKIAGNHAMLIVGWCKFGGKLYFKVLNSYSDRWHDKGLCWMSERYIKWALTNDLHVIHGWNRLTKAIA